MVVEGTPAIFVTFVMAILGYVGLMCVVLLTVKDRPWMWLWRIVVPIIFIHVLMVWMFRYEWQFDLAVRNGYAGFIIFHSALISILVSVFCRCDWAQKLIHLSFLIVTLGAIGASFRYEDVAIYRFVVIGCGLVGGIGLVRYYILDRPHNL
jgi:hypothetical protein